MRVGPAGFRSKWPGVKGGKAATSGMAPEPFRGETIWGLKSNGFAKLGTEENVIPPG